MPRFQLLGAKHDMPSGVRITKGQIFKSPHALHKMFPNKYLCLDHPESPDASPAKPIEFDEEGNAVGVHHHGVPLRTSINPSMDDPKEHTEMLAGKKKRPVIKALTPGHVGLDEKEAAAAEEGEAEDIPSEEDSGEEEGGKVESPLGEDVTEDFEDAEAANMKVFKEGKTYHVAHKDDVETKISKKAGFKKKSEVEKFIIDNAE